mgnify:CR=1 FL=1
MAKLSNQLYNEGSINYCFAEYPSAKIFKKHTGRSWYNHLLFGDYVKILDTNIKNKRVRVRCRGNTGWMKIDEIRKDRILEVNFVDIGQGDGCHMVTPDDQHFIIDSGKGDNMNRYLTWRFYLYNKTKPMSFPLNAVISHSDLDHYGGFRDIFKNKLLHFNKIYHNCLVERPGDLPFGEQVGKSIFELVRTSDEMKALITNAANRKGKRSTYCKTINYCLKYSKNVEFKGLLEENKYVDQYEKNNKIENKQFSMRVLGPIHEEKSGRKYLRSIKDTGKDKNGHSLILKVIYDKVRILLGGDVNSEFGEIIHKYYKDKGELNELVVDAAKACHHGSNHFNYEFLESINSGVTVISSGDEESYGHPRPDAIGAFGKCGYGKRPLIFSTELSRSNVEITLSKAKELNKLFNKVDELTEELKTVLDTDEAGGIRKKIAATNKKINSFLTKYGMINLRTDGKRMIMASKLEVQSAHSKWDIHMLEYSNQSKRFELIRDH